MATAPLLLKLMPLPPIVVVLLMFSVPVTSLIIVGVPVIRKKLPPPLALNTPLLVRITLPEKLILPLFQFTVLLLIQSPWRLSDETEFSVLVPFVVRPAVTAITPPVQLKTLLTVTGPAPPSVPKDRLRLFNVAVRLRFSVPPATSTRPAGAKLPVPVLLISTVPLLKRSVPAPLNAASVKVKAPPPKSSVPPLAVRLPPVPVPPLPRVSVPLCTSMLPVLLNGTLMLAVAALFPVMLPLLVKVSVPKLFIERVEVMFNVPLLVKVPPLKFTEPPVIDQSFNALFELLISV